MLALAATSRAVGQYTSSGYIATSSARVHRIRSVLSSAKLQPVPATLPSLSSTLHTTAATTMPYDEALLKDQSRHFWSVTLRDKADSMPERNALQTQHKERLTAFKAEHPGVINFGGPMLDVDSHIMVGTVFVLKRGEVFPTRQSVEEWVEKDPFHQHGVWVRRDIDMFLGLTTPTPAQ